MRVEAKGGRHPLIFDVGRVARQADGSVLVYQGDSVVLVTATASKEERKGVDFLPLVVEYQEMSYAAGRIKGGFIKRDGRPGNQEILMARCIDRPIRPLFPKNFRNELQIIAMVLSADPDCRPDVMAINGASAALHISSIPFSGPIGGVRVGLIDGEFMVDPSVAQLENSTLELLVVGTKDAIVMVEGEAKELSEKIILDAIAFGHTRIREVVEAIEELGRLAGKEKMKFSPVQEDQKLYDEIRSLSENRIEQIYLSSHSKQERKTLIDALTREILDRFSDEPEERGTLAKMVFSEVEKKTIRRLMKEKRVR
ncbi:MAG: polyribonucleotide nucleotidyltransferase, partial [Desulfomonilia bacterium]|nr:polyribonucleotide nucleotidyltransferase [Desulfomonilia bacterium]